MGPRMDDAEARFAATLDAAERARLIELLHALLAPPEMSVSRRLGFLISKAHHLFREVADAAVEPYGLEIRHFAALTALADGVPSQRELADRLRVSTPVVVEIVDSLEGAGFVERRRDPGDRRSNALVVTDTGRTTLVGATVALQGVSNELIAPIGEPGDAELRALLAKLLEL
jgi:DNA-binding MarR family transcriptional regulator